MAHAHGLVGPSIKLPISPLVFYMPFDSNTVAAAALLHLFTGVSTQIPPLIHHVLRGGSLHRLAPSAGLCPVAALFGLVGRCPPRMNNLLFLDLAALAGSRLFAGSLAHKGPVLPEVFHLLLLGAAPRAGTREGALCG